MSAAHIHPIFVHFTVALFVVASLCLLSTQWISDKKIHSVVHTAGLVNLAIGAVITLITVITGWIAYHTLYLEGEAAQALHQHMIWAMVTMAAYLFITLMMISRIPYGLTLPKWLYPAIVAALGILSITAFKGGELVFHYGMSVDAVPVLERTESSEPNDHASHH